MKKAWIYTRTGYETNDKNESQLNTAIEYCKTNGIAVKGFSSFNGESDTPMVLFENAFRKMMSLSLNQREGLHETYPNCPRLFLIFSSGKLNCFL